MISAIGGPVELIMVVSVIHGVLCLTPSGVNECERLAHERFLPAWRTRVTTSRYPDLLLRTTQYIKRAISEPPRCTYVVFRFDPEYSSSSPESLVPPDPAGSGPSTGPARSAGFES